MNRWTTGSLYHTVPETVATKMCFDKMFCGLFHYIFFYLFIKVLSYSSNKTHNRYFIEYEYEEIHLFMILYLDL